MPKAVIMAGGQGERFWLITHKHFPKYRIRFDGTSSLLQKTYRRLVKVYGPDNVYLVTTRPHVQMIREELPRLKVARIFVEPFRNNTCAAIYLSSALLEKKFGSGETVSFFPADHLIRDENAFKKTMRGAIRLDQKKEVLVMLGIPPVFPATVYGYIECGAHLQGEKDSFHVRRFVEKPNAKTARRYLKQGNFFWNGGIFTWRLGVYLKAMARTCPDFHKYFNPRRLNASYRKLPNLSIDVALLEKTRNLALRKGLMDWCDLGDLDMFYEKSSWDERGNHAQGISYRQEVRGSLVLNHTQQPLVVSGVSGLVIVQTPQGTLICKKGLAPQTALLSKKL